VSGDAKKTKTIDWENDDGDRDRRLRLLFKRGRKHEQTREAPAEYKELTSVAIVPFGISPAATASFVRVSMTRGALGLIQTTLGK
jgi:hypothetical protein